MNEGITIGGRRLLVEWQQALAGSVEISLRDTVRVKDVYPGNQGATSRAKWLKYVAGRTP